MYAFEPGERVRLAGTEQEGLVYSGRMTGVVIVRWVTTDGSIDAQTFLQVDAEEQLELVGLDAV